MAIRITEVAEHILPQKIAEALEVAAQIVENDAKRKCPVDNGTLRASITHVTKETRVVIGTNVEYAPYVHEGTGIYAKNGNGRQTPWTYRSADGTYHRTVGQKPKPFLQDALDEEMPNILDCFKELI